MYSVLRKNVLEALLCTVYTLIHSKNAIVHHLQCLHNHNPLNECFHVAPYVENCMLKIGRKISVTRCQLVAAISLSSSFPVFPV